jgi:hypothetical protein
LKWENIEVKEPGEGEVKIRHMAVGINFVDVNYRKGLYSTKTPFIPGSFPVSPFQSFIFLSRMIIYLLVPVVIICGMHFSTASVAHLMHHNIYYPG